MATQHIVVDGSNIATEGRSVPSLFQLEGAVEELRREFSEAEVTVVVDATFAHRIDPSELERFEASALRGEYVSPPAGAIGRGDAFLLRIAEKVDGIVLSNDSFQEFHGEHKWLFDRGRLIGATPVPGVGWIFVPRSPVRGPRSRVAVRDTQKERDKVVQAIAEATKEVVEPARSQAVGSDRQPRVRQPAEKPQAVNDPITFIGFIATHHLGEEISGEVASFTSHGAVVQFGEVRCYAPLSNLADPPPRSAREILRRAETRTFVITALDPYRRGIELALPGIGTVSGKPTEETVAGELAMTRKKERRVAPTKALAPPAKEALAPRRSARASLNAAKVAPPQEAPAKRTRRVGKVAASKVPALVPSAADGMLGSAAALPASAETKGARKRSPAKRVGQENALSNVPEQTSKASSTRAAAGKALAADSPLLAQGVKATAKKKAATKKPATKAPSSPGAPRAKAPAKKTAASPAAKPAPRQARVRS